MRQKIQTASKMSRPLNHQLQRGPTRGLHSFYPPVQLPVLQHPSPTPRHFLRRTLPSQDSRERHITQELASHARTASQRSPRKPHWPEKISPKPPDSLCTVPLALRTRPRAAGPPSKIILPGRRRRTCTSGRARSCQKATVGCSACGTSGDMAAASKCHPPHTRPGILRRGHPPLSSRCYPHFPWRP